MPLSRRDILKVRGAAIAASTAPSLPAAEKTIAPLTGPGLSTGDANHAARTPDPVQDDMGVSVTQ